jgi:hypothetical protein
MACGDLLATIISAPGVIKYLTIGMEWTAGIITCRANYFLVFVAMFCSVYSLVAITFDRFMAVSRPFKYKSLSSWIKYILPFTWIAPLTIPFLINLHEMKLNKYDLLKNNKTYCLLPDISTKAMVTVSVAFLIPHVVMVILYSMIAYKLWTRRVPGEGSDAQQNGAQQTAKKVTRMIVCILFAFCFSWAPIYCAYIIPYFHPQLNDNYFFLLFIILSDIVMISNGVFNAVIYATFNENFRRAFNTALGIERLTGVCRSFRNRFKRNKVSVDLTLSKADPND